MTESITLIAPSFRKLLAGDHERLNALFDELTNAAAAPVDKRTLCDVWRRLEGGLLAHLEAEETVLFPRFEAEHPGVVASLRFDHQRIRALLTQVGVDVELHVVREHTLDDLVKLLRRHAETEDRTLYHWAEEIPEEAERGDLFARLRARLGGGMPH